MSDKIEGMPDGWRLVRIGNPKVGEWFIDADDGEPLLATCDVARRVRAIIEKIEQPKQYRPFANAAEFEPHRDRWWMFKTDIRDQRRPPQSYDNRMYWIKEWKEMLEEAVFDDGSPFGVEVTE